MLPQNATAETTSAWLAYNRYGQYVKDFNNFDARDMLRLSKDELVQIIGLRDGVRLHNDLHMKPVSPRLLLYLAVKGDSLFTPVLLQEVTVAELVRNISEIAEVTFSQLTKYRPIQVQTYDTALLMLTSIFVLCHILTLFHAAGACKHVQ